MENSIFGTALTRALLQESTAWQMENTILVRYSQQHKESVIVDNGPGKFQKGGKGDGRNSSQNGNDNNNDPRPARASHMDGKKFCTFFQSPKGGCRQAAKCKDLHKCNRVLKASGKPCGGDHPAFQHKKEQHGEVKIN